jgi:transcriptional regulator of acetoin/glycerol metabolism
MDDDALAALKSYAWPGNVRELENVIERAVVVSEGALITMAELPAEIQPKPYDANSAQRPEWPIARQNPAQHVSAVGVRPEREEYGQRERERLVRALAAALGNKAEAARALGLARSTLVSRLKKYGLS